MRIQYISDIHLEFMTKIPHINVIADVLCLAGDIGYPYSSIYKDFLIKMNSSFKKVFIIAGNLEYYNTPKQLTRSIDENNIRIESLISFHNLSNTTFLNNSYEIYNDIIFAGTTLWSHIPSTSITDTWLMNDFKMIENMTYDNYNSLHKKSCKFIEELLATTHTNENTNKKIVMLTHHIPSYELIHKNYIFSNTNCFFASDCDKYFVEPIKAWIYGHTHSPSMKTINNIQFASNPKGYPNENATIKFETIEV